VLRSDRLYAADVRRREELMRTSRFFLHVGIAALLLTAHAADLPREEWFVLKARRPGVSARDLGREYGLEELRAYQDRSRAGVDARRGFSFTDRHGGYPGQKEPPREASKP
jgi:hypothetical protein